MKKGLIIICAIILLSGCDSKKETKENITIAHKKLINFVTTGCY